LDSVWAKFQQVSRGDSPMETGRDRENDDWTLWSFRHRKTLDLWFEELKKNNIDNVLVFCSKSNFHQSESAIIRCHQYKAIDKDDQSPFLEIPSTIYLPLHSDKDKEQVYSAFIVEKIFYPPVDFENETVQ
jgi:hypothetical protein